MLDQYANKNLDKTEARKNVASKLGLKKDWPIVACPVGIFGGASQTLDEVGRALKQTGMNAYFIPRYHPRMAQNAPEEVGLWAEALKTYGKEGLVADSSSCKTPEILEAADLIISEFSTSLLEAAVLGKPGISVFYLSSARKLFHKEFGDLMAQPPFVTLGLTYSAKDTEDLTKLIAEILSRLDENLLNPAQLDFVQKHVDGKNAQRVAKFVDSLV